MSYQEIHAKQAREREARWKRIDTALATGYTPRQIAEDEGVTLGAISRQASRHGRTDIARKFDTRKKNANVG